MKKDRDFWEEMKAKLYEHDGEKIPMKKFKVHKAGGLYVGQRAGNKSTHLMIGTLVRGYYTVNGIFWNCAWVLKCEDGKERSYQWIVAITPEQAPAIRKEREEYLKLVVPRYKVEIITCAGEEVEKHKTFGSPRTAKAWAVGELRQIDKELAELDAGEHEWGEHNYIFADVHEVCKGSSHFYRRCYWIEDTIIYSDIERLLSWKEVVETRRKQKLERGF